MRVDTTLHTEMTTIEYNGFLLGILLILDVLILSRLYLFWQTRKRLQVIGLLKIQPQSIKFPPVFKAQFRQNPLDGDVKR